MAKLKITPNFRSRLSEKLMDLGNFVAAGLVIGQFVSGQVFSITTLTLGIIGTVLLYYTKQSTTPLGVDECFSAEGGLREAKY